MQVAVPGEMVAAVVCRKSESESVVERNPYAGAGLGGGICGRLRRCLRRSRRDVTVSSEKEQVGLGRNGM